MQGSARVTFEGLQPLCKGAVGPEGTVGGGISGYSLQFKERDV